jgi:hypothetical protein
MLKLGRRSRISVLATAVAGALALVAVPAAQASVVTCGQTLTANTTFSSNVTGCPGDGVVIGANNIVVNLNGHTLQGTGGGDGVNFNGYDGVTLMNGRIQNFFDDVYNDGDNNKINSITTRNASNAGIRLYYANNTKVNSGNEGNEYDGIYATYSNNSVVNGVTATLNVAYPFYFEYGSFNTITKSTGTSSQGNTAFTATGENNDTLTYNTARGSSDGFDFEYVGGTTTVTRNVASSNDYGFYAYYTYGPVNFSLNQAHHNATVGFAEDYTGHFSSGNTYNGDVAQFNGTGFSVRNSLNVLLKAVVAGSSSNLRNGGGGNGDGVFIGYYSDGATVLNSKANSNNPYDGISIDDTATNTTLNGNTTNANANDGVNDDSSSTTLSNSLAAWNLNYGFFAPLATDGGGNHAHDNGTNCTVNISC